MRSEWLINLLDLIYLHRFHIHIHTHIHTHIHIVMKSKLHNHNMVYYRIIKSHLISLIRLTWHDWLVISFPYLSYHSFPSLSLPLDKLIDSKRKGNRAKFVNHGLPSNCTPRLMMVSRTEQSPYLILSVPLHLTSVFIFIFVHLIWSLPLTLAI